MVAHGSFGGMRGHRVSHIIVCSSLFSFDTLQLWAIATTQQLRLWLPHFGNDIGTAVPCLQLLILQGHTHALKGLFQRLNLFLLGVQPGGSNP